MKNDKKSSAKESKSTLIPKSRIKSEDLPFNRELAIEHPIHGNKMTHTYREIIAPVFILNAMKRSLDSGKEEKVTKIDEI